MRPNILRTVFFCMATILYAAGAGSSSFAQNTSAQPLKFNKTSHKFGKIAISEGPQKCTFEFTNTGNKPVVINNIITSCGCTEPVWPKAPIMPGKSGTIEVTYLNNQGPYPFDKSLTVYTSASSKPIILRISGVAYEKEKSFKELFPVRIGPLGIKNNRLRLGQIEQGDSKSQTVTVANLSSQKVSLAYTSASSGLSLKADPETIAPDGLSEIVYTVNTASGQNWGNTVYTVWPVCNGIKSETPLEIECMILERTSHLSKAEKAGGSMVLAKNSSVNPGTVSKEKPLAAEFHLRNTGAKDLIIHKADVNVPEMKVTYPQSVKPGEEFTVSALVNPSGYKGEQVFTITLITNSPMRPLVNLFIIADIK